MMTLSDLHGESIKIKDKDFEEKYPQTKKCSRCNGSGYYRDLGGGGYTEPARVDDDFRLPCNLCNKKGYLTRKVIY